MTSIYDQFVARYGRLPTEYDSDYLEMLNMSKYRTLTAPDVQPGKCANCGASKKDGRTYVDFGLHVDWYGAVFLCSLCLQDIAKNTGLFIPFENKIAIMQEKANSSAILESQGVALQDTVLRTYEEVKSYFASIQSSGNDPSSDNNSIADTQVVGADPESGTDQTEPAVDTTKSRTTKSNNGAGSKNVPSLTSLLESKA